MTSEYTNGKAAGMFFYTMGSFGALCEIGVQDISLLTAILIAIVIILVYLYMVSLKPGKNIDYDKYKRLSSIMFLGVTIELYFMHHSVNIFFIALLCYIFPIIFYSDSKLMAFHSVGSVIAIIAMLFYKYFQGEMTHKNWVEFAYGSGVCILVLWMCYNVIRMQEEQRRRYAEQSRTIDDMVDIIKEKCDTAKAATKSKSDFLSHMSHEIRTPLGTVLGMNEMILRESTQDEILEYAGNVDSAGKHLLSLINDILDVSKIESGRMEIVPVRYELSSIIRDVVVMTKNRSEKKGLKLNLNIDETLPSVLRGDDVRFRQILTNLLSNAVKYTKEGEITLSMHGTRISDTVLLKCEVIDTGIGIRKEDINRLFDAFERVEQTKNHHIEGTGLGLNITVNLLNLMGSKLQVDSIYKKGSTFSFELLQSVVDEAPIGPVDDIMAYHTKRYQRHDMDLRAPDAKVLVVDDNRMNRMVFQNLLKQTMIQIDEADSGKMCLEMIAQNRYHMVFLDHMMPEMDGIETLHHIKEDTNHKCQQTPIVALTANAVANSKMMYLGEGFDDFLGKPIFPPELEEKLSRYLPKDLIL